MNSGEQVPPTTGLNRGTNCPRCGRGLHGSATFCGHCGAELAKAQSINTTADMNFVALAVTLVWSLYMLFWVSHPFTTIAVDPIASLHSTVLYTGFWTALAAPFIAVLLLAALMSWRAGGRLRFPQFRRDEGVPSPPIVGLVTIVWVGVSLVVGSEPGPGFTLGLPWLLFTGLVGLAWLVCTVRDASVTWKQPGIPNAASTLGYAIQVPIAVIFLYSAGGREAALEARFELSEDALTRYVQEFNLKGEESMSTVQMVGLYQIGPPDRRHGCVRVTTNAVMDYYAGFAYCPDGPLPTKPNEKFDHFLDNWWRFEVHH
jgi:uncharacterized protein (DUF983 family)